MELKIITIVMPDILSSCFVESSIQNSQSQFIILFPYILRMKHTHLLSFLDQLCSKTFFRFLALN